MGDVNGTGLTPAQRAIIDALIERVASSLEGHGEVCIVITGGKVRLIRYMISLDANKIHTPFE